MAASQGQHGDETVAQRIRGVRNRVAPAELAVINCLLENYPMAGLMPVAQLAGNASVSAPTVLRLVGKLGFPGYAAFQKALRDEVSTRLFSPVDVYPEARAEGGAGTNALTRAQSVFLEGIQATFAHLDAAELERVIGLLADPQRQIVLLGGRFSAVLATHLGAYLTMLRPGVQVVGPHSGARIPAMIDVNKRTVAVVFDYRRYQKTTIDWGLEAARRGAHIVLITDQYLSPLATHAGSLLTNSATGLAPFDSMTSGFALVELMISLLAQKLGRTARTRLADFEALQRQKEDHG
ncbi:MurR/RpiR family transcriptional regulator [Robbsia sp. Bb-Pol-6]|uniref:MurR/RpiR family transcriptional regulator n=1 Tax=Robbsia betulipollinis TaxID=2981849 RepID=A0ABT3ZHB7_9BURK|nr:MurR/RpiR family transcriptional regulator [Robbsia betulipollinis]MCY0385914.1 MurR/RpiR family transcriptional regulator [Robbsia betulipollinis]